MFISLRFALDHENLHGATALSLRAQRSNLIFGQRLLRHLRLLAMTFPSCNSFFGGMTHKAYQSFQLSFCSRTGFFTLLRTALPTHFSET